MQPFGTTLRNARNKAGMSLCQLARSLDVSAAYLSDVELGRRGPFRCDKIHKISKILKVDPAELLISAAIGYGFFLLPYKDDLYIDMVAASLVLVWDSLSSGQLNKIYRVLEDGGERQ